MASSASAPGWWKGSGSNKIALRGALCLLRMAPLPLGRPRSEVLFDCWTAAEIACQWAPETARFWALNGVLRWGALQRATNPSSQGWSTWTPALSWSGDEPYPIRWRNFEASYRGRLGAVGSKSFPLRPDAARENMCVVPQVILGSQNCALSFDKSTTYSDRIASRRSAFQAIPALRPDGLNAVSRPSRAAVPV